MTGELLDLEPAGETIGHHRPTSVMGTDGWKQRLFRAGDGDVIVPVLEAEVACESATTLRRRSDLDARSGQDSLVRLRSRRRPLVEV